MTWARNASSNVSIPLSTLSSLALMQRNSPRQRDRRCCSSFAALGYLVGSGRENFSRRSLASKTMTAMLDSTNVAILAAPNLVSIASISMRVFSMETVVLAAYIINYNPCRHETTHRLRDRRRTRGRSSSSARSSRSSHPPLRHIFAHQFFGDLELLPWFVRAQRVHEVDVVVDASRHRGRTALEDRTPGPVIYARSHRARPRHRESVLLNKEPLPSVAYIVRQEEIEPFPAGYMGAVNRIAVNVDSVLPDDIRDAPQSIDVVRCLGIVSIVGDIVTACLVEWLADSVRDRLHVTVSCQSKPRTLADLEAVITSLEANTIAFPEDGHLVESADECILQERVTENRRCPTIDVLVLVGRQVCAARAGRGFLALLRLRALLGR